MNKKTKRGKKSFKFKISIKKKTVKCPICNKGIIKRKTKKNYYHGKKSTSRYTKWDICNICDYQRLKLK